MLIMMLIVSCFCLGRDTYCLSLLCGVSIGFVIMVLRLQAAKYWFRVSVFFFLKKFDLFVPRCCDCCREADRHI